MRVQGLYTTIKSYCLQTSLPLLLKTIMATPYKLRCNLAGHEKDVRSLANSLIPENGLISGSRDNTSCVWTTEENGSSLLQTTIHRGHSNFVSSLCVMPPDDTYPQGLIITGSNDKSILAYTPGSSEPVFKLIGHEGNVCALASGKFGFLLSGSWDKTARVWLNQKCVMVLEGHEMAVWAVGIISGEGIMLTGSADKTIKAWKAGKSIQTYKGHTDCVRGLAVVSESEFLSCSNDASIRRWAVTSGDCLNVYFGHTNYVYSISILPNGEDFITGGEDRTLRIWKDGECAQTIYHPCESVWAVCAMPNGDVATGASDGMIRIFTQSSERVASQEILETYEAALASAPVAAQPLGDIKVEDLPGPDSLKKPGKKDGQTTMVNTEGSVDVYQWDAAQNKWIKIGNVVGSSGATQRTSGKTLHEGKEYDYVFTVDIQEGAPPLKLPFNISEDPWMAAQKFIDKHQLPQAYLEQVSNFITENTKGVTLGTGSTMSYADPFTGGDRYVPGKDDPMNGAVNGSDPFTGSGRYVPSEQNNASKNSHFPVKSYVFFDNISPAEQILGKLKEFNKSVGEEHCVPDKDLDGLIPLVEGNMTSEGIKTLDRLISWPQEYTFPALDILRISIKHSGVCRLFCERPGFTDLLCGLSSPGSPQSCRMLAMRTFANMFREECGVKLLVAQMDPVLQAAITCRDLTTKNAQIAVATLVLNYCIKMSQTDDLDAKAKCLQAGGELLTRKTFDPEASYRLLIGVGTLVNADDGAKALAHSIDLPAIITQHQSSDLGKLVECAKFLSNILSG